MVKDAVRPHDVERLVREREALGVGPSQFVRCGVEPLHLQVLGAQAHGGLGQVDAGHARAVFDPASEVASGADADLEDPLAPRLGECGESPQVARPLVA
jgi:hypothetical protein